MSKQIKELQKMVKDLQSQLQTEKVHTEQLKHLKVESLKKDQQAIELNTKMNQIIIDLKKQQNEQNEQWKIKLEELVKTNNKQFDNLRQVLTNNIEQLKTDNIELKKQLEQYQIKFSQKNQNTNIQSQMDIQIEEKQKNEQKEKLGLKNCENILLFIQSSNLKNGVDFLLVTENRKKIKLKNNEWNNYNFGIFLLGERITLTLDYDRQYDEDELGHLKIKTSHLWIKYSSSKIDCSQLGYPGGQGPGKGEKGSGGGYGTDGTGGKGDYGQAGKMYGEETLLKQIHFGSGGGGGVGIIGGSGGGIIELTIEQQLINHGSIQSNGGNSHGGGGSGGSILIELQCQYLKKLKQTFGTIKCIGGGGGNRGGKGRIAIYGIELSSNDILKMDPKPFNRIHK
ncbi:hypothetical protein RFI_39328 [Reticulomyxa filosa]|uniref:Uncharacterized protein n=1 Tax=Reticulomyxa filosa TaxID=46433 RepID=X6L898_RETFI|nr:hypothetical protein RFI_39328 [Reticulomyxa filosa]|eukprot:ETN98187.1 hypothetical protein RFI_39328 [Reticulomyxa filosa]